MCAFSYRGLMLPSPRWPFIMPTGLALAGTISPAGAALLRGLRPIAWPVCSLSGRCPPAFAHSCWFGQWPTLACDRVMRGWAGWCGSLSCSRPLRRGRAALFVHACARHHGCQRIGQALVALTGLHHAQPPMLAGQALTFVQCESFWVKAMFRPP